jgi:SAM-dependent methyltransferase
VPADANLEWERWGEFDPYFGVSSWPGKEAGSPQAWTEDEFFALGEKDWQDFRVRWERYGLKKGVALEIGCGAGRLTRAMARDFDHVHGIDVAPGMLKRAAAAVSGLSVTLHHSDGIQIPLPDQSVDAVFSTHVFQHLDTIDDAAANWREVERVLRPGGSLLVHLPVHMWPGGLERLQAAYNARRLAGDLRARYNRRRIRRDASARPIMRGQCYEWSTLDSSLQELGMTDVELLVFRVSSNHSQHSCVLARRSEVS